MQVARNASVAVALCLIFGGAMAEETKADVTQLQSNVLKKQHELQREVLKNLLAAPTPTPTPPPPRDRSLSPRARAL